MNANASSEEPEFTYYQQELDAAFHSRNDVFPAGTPEHAELLSFVTKLYKLRKTRPETAADATPAADPLLAERLGLPSSYDARFRISASLVIPPERLSTAIRSVARRMAMRAAAAAPAGARGTYSSCHSSGRDERRRDRGGGSGGASGSCGGGSGGGSGGRGGDDGRGVTPDMVQAATRVVEEYRRLLPWFEDFYQRRQMSRWRKLQADRASLPAAAFREPLLAALAGAQAVVVAGDTG
ncbi:hypothetical protein Agub_g15719, partial [Astrephomene gubernaculifera]